MANAANDAPNRTSRLLAPTHSAALNGCCSGDGIVAPSPPLSPPSRSPNTAEEEEEEEEEEEGGAARHDGFVDGGASHFELDDLRVRRRRQVVVAHHQNPNRAVVPRFERVHPLHVPDGSVVPVQQRRDVNRRAGDPKRIGSNRSKRSGVIAGDEIVAVEQDHHDGPVGCERGVRRRTGTVRAPARPKPRRYTLPIKPSPPPPVDAELGASRINPVTTPDAFLASHIAR